MIELDIYLSSRSEVGEGPVWDDVRRGLVWVDVTRGEVHVATSTGDSVVHRAVGTVGAALPAVDGTLLVAEANSLVRVRDGLPPQFVADVEPGRADVRLNDAKCDPRGRAFAGTMAYDWTPGAGALYRLDPQSVVRCVHDFTLTNGLGWSPDGSEMYIVDTVARAISVYSYDLSTGDVGELLRVIDTDEPGLPDGLCVDAEGYLWVAFWDGWAVRRYAPNGHLDRVVALPVARPTSCCFGGDDLRTFFITTASLDLDEQALQNQPNAGAIFVGDAGVQGLPTARWSGALSL